jgi:hypothetical protein
MLSYIKYKDKKLPYKVSYYAISRLQKETGKGLENFQDDMTILEPLLYYALEAGHKHEDIEFEISREDIPFMLDDQFSEFLVNVSASVNPPTEKK